MQRTDEDEALDAVIADMGHAVKDMKSKRYAPKPKPVETAPDAAAEQPIIGAEQLESLLNAG